MNVVYVYEQLEKGSIMLSLRSILLCVASLTIISAASAQEFPHGQVLKIIVPANAGGTNDIIARAVQPALSQAFGVPVIIENKIGAGGRTGAQEVARAAPDGRTILMSASHIQATQKWVYRSMSYDPEKDLSPLAMVGLSSNVLLVSSSVPVNNVKELISFLRANPGKLSYSSVGVGTSSHLGAELFKSLTGTYVVHVPYNGSAPALKDLLGGITAMQFENMPTALPHIGGGRVKALAVTTPQRSPLLPDVPTMSEAGVAGFEAAPWYCFVAPAGTPPAIVARWNKELEAAMSKPEFVALMQRIGIQRMPMSPEQLLAFQTKENVKWKAIVERSGAKMD